ncbi:sugar nucleotide-binding protein [Marinobacteraceae bacterium S3BR75-40.1]
MRVLVIHEWGFLGRLLLDQLRQTDLEVTPLLLSKPDEVDLTQLPGWVPDDVDMVINTLTSTDPLWVEQAPDMARHRLYDLPCALGKLCAERDLAMLQLSSCYVFDGRKQSAYISSNPGNPISQLGILQWDAEQHLRAHLPRHLILRTGWSLERFLAMVMKKERLAMSSRCQGQPVAMEDLARVITAMVQQVECGAEVWGTYQYAGAEEITLYELGLAILETVQPEPAMDLVDDVESWTELEPENATLGCNKIKNTFGIKQRPWRSYIENEWALLKTGAPRRASEPLDS